MDGTGITRRRLIAGGGIGVGLVLAYAAWPRSYRPNLTAAAGESIFDAFLKIGEDGHVTVVVPQAEMGQGVYTSLPQILADELGADWRTVAVEPAPINPLYANDFLAKEAAEQALPGFLQDVGTWAAHEYALRSTLMITGGSSSVRGFEGKLRTAGAAARVMLCMAAAERWEVDWRACDTEDGFVTRGPERLRFGALAAEAAAMTPPSDLPLRAPAERKLSGRPLPRLDLPAKVDGSARFAGDVRLPDMVFAAIRQAPLGDSRLVTVDKAAADRIPGVVAVFEHPGWVAATATNWWAANRALDALAPRFATRGDVPDSAAIAAALRNALDGDGTRFAAVGDVDAAFADTATLAQEYSVGLAPHAALEPMVATARVGGDRLELWLPTQAPAFARAAVARATGLAEAQITLYPMLLGGSFGAKLEAEAACQAAVLSLASKRPVQLMWSRAEDTLHDRFRPPALARMRARIGPAGRLLGWHAKIAAPSTAGALGRRLTGRAAVRDQAEAAAVEGAAPPYAIPAYAVDHHPAAIGVPTGAWRSVAHSYTAFFTECFVDELAAQAAIDPLSFRMQLLGDAPRLAHCLSTAAALGGWEGGGAGTGQGLACHSCFGSHVAMLAEIHVDTDRQVKVDRVVAVVDCGRMINPEIVRQQIEGGIVFGLGAALGGEIGVTRGLVDARNFDALRLPRLADCPEIVVELVRSAAPPGGVGEIAVPPIAPAIANALFATTAKRARRLPIALDA